MNRKVVKIILLENTANVIDKANNYIQNANVANKLRFIYIIDILFHSNRRRISRKGMRKFLEENK
jgi:hypothetical protein